MNKDTNFDEAIELLEQEIQSLKQQIEWHEGQGIDHSHLINEKEGLELAQFALKEHNSEDFLGSAREEFEAANSIKEDQHGGETEKSEENSEPEEETEDNEEDQ